MVTAYEKRAGAELTYKEKPKLYVKKPVYRPRLPKKPRQIPRYKPPPRPRQRAVQPRQRPSSSQPRVRYHTPARAARAATPAPRARIVQDEHEIDYPEEKQAVVRDSADNRLSRIYEMQAKKQQQPKRTSKITRKRRHLLFMNPGEQVIMNCILSFTQNRQLPAWARPFRQNLRYNRNSAQLIWIDSENPRGLPFALFHDKRDAVKTLYFDPREPSTIQPITEKLYRIWANINRRNVTRILRSLETYQLNFGRRRPPDLKNRFFMRNPGMIVMDMFFPSPKLGWAKTNVLVCADAWSRYTSLRD